MIEEDGTGLPNSTTYVAPLSAYATAYVGAHLYVAAWTAATAPQREQAVDHATRTLDALYDWNGTILNPIQALGWPRVGVEVDGRVQPPVPGAIKAATIEMALALLERNRTSDTASGTQPLDKIDLGDGALVLEFGADPSAAPTASSAMIPPYIRKLLRDFGTTAGGGMKPVERR